LVRARPAADIATVHIEDTVLGLIIYAGEAITIVARFAMTVRILAAHVRTIAPAGATVTAKAISEKSHYSYILHSR